MSEAGRVRIVVPPVPGDAYDVIVERGGLARLGEMCAEFAPAHAYALISDSRVAELYGRAALDSLGETGQRTELFVFPAGEWNKSRQTWAELSDALLAAGFGRDTVVVGLGGGVTGDLAGFVAATFMRGVPVVQLPTTVLAMVDSSVGGKTGVDAHDAKNAIGSFHHPALVLADPDLLVTLAPFQRTAGLAESVKMAAMRDAGLFEWIASSAPELRDGDPDAITRLIAQSVGLKAAVVEADPKENGERAILNFGHTAGHALETLSGFSLLHGEAVAQGMRLEARLGERVGLTESGTADRLDVVLSACGLPLELDPDLTSRGILDAAGSDKKAREGALRWSIPARIGEAARTASGAWTHSIQASRCESELGAALRTASEVPDSPA
jgi:3-dehydroquinate synthase